MTPSGLAVTATRQSSTDNAVVRDFVFVGPGQLQTAHVAGLELAYQQTIAQSRVDLAGNEVEAHRSDTRPWFFRLLFPI